MSPGVWMGDWIWSLTFLFYRRKKKSVKHSLQKANDAVIAYKKRMLSKPSRGRVNR